MAEPFIGEIKMVGFNFPPRGWATCDGQLISISQNSALFSLLGTAFGGDGRTTFGLPDLRGRSALHVGSGPGLDPISQGQKGGSLTPPLPAHSHNFKITCTSGGGTTDDPSGQVLSTANEDIYASTGSQTMAQMTTDSAGTGGNFRGPYLGIYHVIALQGLYPSRS